MKLLRAGLQGGAERGPRRKTVVRAVVRSQSLRFCDGIHGRHDAGAAGSATIRVLASVKQEEVVRGSISVKAGADISVDWRRRLKVRHQVGGAWRQDNIGVDTPAVCGKFRDLLPADQRALLATVALKSDAVRFHDNDFRFPTDLQLNVNSHPVIYVQYDSLGL